MDTYERLVEQAQSTANDEFDRREAFSELVNRFQDAAFHWAYDVLEDAHLAQDAAQEAFIAAYTHLDQLREPAAFPGWLKQIVLTRCNRLTRRKSLTTGSFDDDMVWNTESHDPADEAEARDIKDRVMEAVHDLPEHERTVTELFYLTGYSQREIAEHLHLPVTTVKKRLQYARERLRIAMPDFTVNAALHIGADSPEVLLDVYGDFGPYIEIPMGIAYALTH